MKDILTSKTAFSALSLRHAAFVRIVQISLLLWLVSAGAAHGYIIINAPMTDTNSSGWVLGGNPSSASLTGNGATDPVGSGWLRITNNSGNQTGFAYNTTPFDLSSGALIQFDYATWGGNGADGISVFLFDAGVPTFNIGAFGGSLGYAQKLPPTVTPAVPGVSGGYVGIGIDEFGNFSNPTEGRYLGPGAMPNTVTIRGSVLGFGNGAIGSTADTTSYPWIATSGNNGLLWINSASRPDQLSTNYRKVIIQISPAPNPTADVWVQFGYNTAPVQMVSGQALPAITASQSLMVGFGGSTGGSTNYHELRNLLITSLNTSTAIDLGITKTPVATGTTTPALTSANVGTAFQYLVTARNYGPNNITATGVGIIDTFPANVTSGSWTCAAIGGATCGAVSGSGNLNTTANLPRAGAVTYTVNATLNSMPAGNLLSNTASLTIPGAVTDYYSGNNSATSTITAYGPPTVTKSFAPSSVPLSTASALSITLTNPNNIAATGVGFTDSYPANLLNAATAVTPQCGGTITAANNGTSLKLANGTIPANGSCTITVNVDSATAATYTNTLAVGAVTTTNIGKNAVASSSTLTILSAPTVAKSFAVGSMAAGDNTNLTVTIGNTNASTITLTSALTDIFPANMTIAAAGNTGTCTGVTATAGDNKFTMASGTAIPAGGCTVIVNVTSSATTGTSTNTIAAGALQTSAGNNAAAAAASLIMHAAATLGKAYSPTTIATGATSTLSFTITNGSGNPAQSGLAFTDTFPAGLTVTAVGAVSGTGCSGTTAFTASTVSLSNGAITSTNSPCSFTATVKGNTGGTYVNNSAQFSGQDGGLVTSATTATLNVYDPPTVTKSFSPTSITVGGTTVLALTLANPATNPGSVTTNKLSDTFPAGLTLKNTTFTFTPSACGTVTKISGAASAAGDNNVLFSAASLASGTSCQVQMNVTSSIANNFTNTTGAPTATGPVALTGTPASAALNGTQAPMVTKAFAVGSMASGGNTNLSVTFSNTNASAVTLTSDFTDTFPTGMFIGTAGNTGTCGGVTATAGSGSFTLANGTSIPVGGCTVIVNVTSSTAGTAVNTIAANALQTSVGNNAAAASATLNVYAPPTVTKSFAPASISYGGTATMTITVTNPAANPGNLTGVANSDTYVGTLVNNAVGSVACSGAGSATLTGGANGGTTVGFTAGTIVPGGTCTITQSVSATATVNNSTSPPTATGPVALTGTAAGPVTLTVVPVAPTVAKAFAVSSLASGDNTNLTVTIGNTNAGAITLTGLFTDTFPSGMTINTAGNTGTCTGVTATAGSSSFTMANGSSIPPGGCTVIVNVKGSTAGTATNTIATNTLQTSAGNNAAPASAALNIYAPPTVAKTFTPASISSGGTSSMTITVTNPAANPGNLTGVGISDTYTGTLTNNASGSIACSGAGSATLTGGANGGITVGFNTGTIIPGGTCTITQSVTSTSATNSNTTTAPTATGPVALTGTTANATLTTTLLPAPTVVKTFAPTQIAKNGSSLLTVTLTNPSGIDITGAAFSDTLPTSPGQMTTASVLTNSCGGTGTIASGNKSFSLSGGTIPANGSCYLSVTVTAATLGTYNNTTSTVTSTNAATASTASASLTVALLAPPNVTKSFASNQISINGTSVMTITLTNPNTSDITGAAFSDNYPNGLFNTGALNAATTCTGGTATATNGAGNGTLTLSSATIPASSSCKVTVSVTSAAAAAYVNSTGPVTTTNANTGSAASATLNVLQAPTTAKAFSPSTLLPGGTSVLTITLTNPNSIAITGAAFTDTYPTFPGAMVNTGTPAGATTCTSGIVTAAANGNSLQLSGATIPGNGSCTVTVNITAPVAGSYTNTINTITTTNAGSIGPISGNLAVMAPPTVSKSFGVANLASGDNTNLTVTIGNTNASAITLTNALTDTFPAGMIINTAGNSGTCPGVTATAGAGSFAMASGNSIPAGGCTMIVNVKSSTTGTATNTIAAGALQTSAGNNSSSASATVNVYAPLTVTKAFGAATIASGVSTTLSLTLTNPVANVAAVTANQVDDLFPAGLTLQNTVFTFTPTACGTVTKTSGAASAVGDNNILFSAASIASGASCQVSVNVTSSTAGGITNTTGAPTTTGPVALTGATATATLNVYAPPTVTKSFAPAGISYGGTSTMTITVTSPAANPGNLTGVAVNDAYVGTLLNNAIGAVACSGGGSATLTGGANGGAAVGFNAGTIVPGGTCTITQSVTATSTNSNTTGTASATGPVALTGLTANATLTVAAVAPTITKAFAIGSLASGGNTNLTVTVGNSNGGAIALTSALTDTFPAGMTINTAGNTGTCAGVTATAGAGNFVLANGTAIPAGGCTVIVNITSTTAGAAVNTIAAGALQTVAGNNAAAATATLNVYAPPTVTKSFAPAGISYGGTSTMTITVTSPAANPGNLTGVAVNDAYVGTLLNNAIGAVACSGGGSATLTGGANGGAAVGFNAGTIVPGGTCTITQSVTATSTNSNTTGTASATGPVALTGLTANATLTVAAVAPTITKAFAIGSLASGGNTNLTVTVGNSNGGAIALTSALTDTFPAGMTINTAGNTGTCAGVTATAGAGNFVLANGTAIPAGGCTVIVNITSTTAGAAVNTIAAGALQTVAGNNAAAATATLNVYAPPTVTKSFAPAGISYGGTSTLTITVTSPAANPGNLTGVAVNDAYVGTLLNNAIGAVACSGGGSATLTGGANGGAAVGFNAGTIVPGGTCTIIQSVTATSTNSNTTGTASATGPVALTGLTANATLTVAAVAPTITKAFAIGSLASGGNTNLTVTVGNSNGGAIALTSALTDTFPAGMTINTAGNTGTCAGVTATAGAGNFVLANGTAIPAGGCTIIVNVKSSTAGAAINTIAAGALQTVAGNNAAAATATLNVYAPPTVTKSFAPAGISYGGTSTLTITVTSPAANPGNLTGVAVNDAYVGTLLNNATGNVVCSGGGSATLTGGANGGAAVGFNAGTIVPGGTCTITQSVTATSTNANTTGTASATGPVALTGLTANATLTVAAVAPTITKAFAVGSLASGGNTNLTVTVGNTNGGAIALTSALTDTFPAGMTINTAGNTGTCAGVTATAGAGNFVLANGTAIPAGGCTIIVNVKSSTAGAAINTIAAGALQTVAGNNAAAATATLNVYAPPTVTKSFAPASISYGGTSTLTITVTNPAANPGNLTGVAVNDAYVGTLLNNATGNVVCSGGGSATLTGGANGGAAVGFNAGTIVPGGTCTITQSVTATSTNANTTGTASATGPVALTGLTANATLTVAAVAPTITKAFAVGSLASGGNTNLTVTVGNSNGGTIALTSALTDTFPAGMTINTAGNTGTCAGVTATAGAGNFVLANGTAIPAGGCTIIVNVKSSTAGAAINTIAAGALQTVAGNNAAAATATLNVYAPPTVTKSFAPAGISYGGTSTLTITVTSPAANPGNLTGVAVNDAYVGTLLNNVIGAVACSGGGSATLTGGANGGAAVGFNAGTIVPGGTCTITQSVTATSTNSNTTGTASATGPVALTGLTANATLTVALFAAPSVAKDFTPASILVNTPSVLTITLTNPNAAAIIGAAFTDNYPANLVNTATPAGTTTCTGSLVTVTAAGNGTSLALSGATLPANGSCTVTVNVTSSTAGSYVNSTGTVTSTNATTSAAASATLTVIGGVSVSGTVYADPNHNSTLDTGEPGTGQTLFVKLAQRSGVTCNSPATASTAADPATGTYSFAVVPAGDYCLVLSNNSTLSDTAPTHTSGWLSTETATGVRSVTVGNTPLTAQNFGMYHGSILSGRVFGDTGMGGGTPNNGVQDGSEAALTGVTVKVTDNGGVIVYNSAVSDGSGNYTLWIPSTAGNNPLKVVETNPGGYLSTGGNVGTTGGSYDRPSDTVTFTNAIGTSYTGVNFGDVPGNTFTANNSRNVVAGGVVFYPHTFTAGTGGNVTFSTSAVASPAISGWSEVFYLDSNCNGSIDLGEPQITAPITTTAGQQVCILVKEFAPATAPLNATNTATVSANFTYSNSTLPPAVLTLTDLTTVSPSGLTLIKYVDKSSALPGDTLTYTITYANTGSTQLDNVVISDNIPAFTSLIPPTSTTVCCVNPSTACLGTPPTPYPAAISGCTTVTTATYVSWTLSGTLDPGASGQVKFSVKIQQ